MTFLDDLNGLPSAANGLTAGHVTLLEGLHASDDRGGFYLAYYHMLDQMEAAGTVPVRDIAEAKQQVLLQAHITTYSGFIGGAALLGNAAAKFGNPEDYDLTLDQFSQDIVGGLLAAISVSIGDPNDPNDLILDGFVTATEIQLADQAVWTSKEMEDYFPGNFQLFDQELR